jgi:hypothetical protein
VGDDNYCMQVLGLFGFVCAHLRLLKEVKFRDVSEALSCPLGGKGWA